MEVKTKQHTILSEETYCLQHRIHENQDFGSRGRNYEELLMNRFIRDRTPIKQGVNFLIF